MKEFLIPVVALLVISSLLFSLIRVYQNKTMPAAKKIAWIVVLIGTILVTLCLLVAWVVLICIIKIAPA